LFQTATISSTVAILVGASFEICIIPVFPLNSTIAQVQVIIVTISQVYISQTVGSQIKFLIQFNAFSAPTLSFQVTKVFQSSSICIFTA
jgi:hypothetical protein